MAAVGPHQVIAVVRTKTGAEWLQRLAAREVSEVVFGPRERVLPYMPICCPALVPSENQRPEYSTATPPTQPRDVASTVALLSPSLAAAAPPPAA